MKVKDFFNLPLQFLVTVKDKWVYIISSTIFFLLFLFIYNPFGIYDAVKSEGNTRNETIFLLFLMASIVFVVLFLRQFILIKKTSHLNYTLKHFIKRYLIDVLIITITVSTIEFLVFEDDDVSSIQIFFDQVIFDSIIFFFELCFILFYPLLGSLIYLYLKQLYTDKTALEEDLDVIKNHYKIVSKNEELVKILDENNACKVTIPINKIYAIESQNQYVSIKYEKNGKIIEQIIRTRLSKILNELNSYPTIVKCHRSFAVNLSLIENLKYLNQKPHLILKSSEETLRIPVSKTYLNTVKGKLSNY